MERRTFLNTAVGISLATQLTDTPLASIVQQDTRQQGLVFLFQGDSITDGNRGRSEDPNHIMGHGYAFAVASRIGADFPKRDCVFYNRGISGNKITDLQKRWTTDTLNLKPDVLSVLIGINDTAAVVDNAAEATTPEEFEVVYRQLLTDCRRQSPTMLLVLVIPFVYPAARISSQWSIWRSDLDKRVAVVQKLAAEFDAILVDCPAVLNKAVASKNVEYWVWDGVHPTVSGHELLARAWLKSVSKPLPFLNKYKGCI